MPAGSGRRGARAPRRSLGRPPRQLPRRSPDRRAAGLRGAAAGAPPAGAVRRARRRLPGPLRPPSRPSRRRQAAGRLQPAGLAGRHVRRRSWPLPAGIARGACAHSDRPEGTSRGKRRSRGHESECRPPGRGRRARSGTGRGLLRRRRGAALPARMVAARAVHVPVRGEAHPASRPRDDPRGGRLGPRSASAARGKRTARGGARRQAAECRVGALGRLRTPSGRAARRRLRARNLRHLRQGAARHPEQGVPGARLRHASRHRRHAGRARAARRRGERLARPAGRPGGARCGRAPPRRGRRPLPAAERGRPSRLRGTGERGRARPALARGAGARGGRVRPPRALLWAAIAAYAAGFSALSVLRHRAFETGRFDLGNMVQAVWSTAHGHPLAVTGLRGDEISRLAAHFDPILVVFAPLWLVWPSPDMLLVSQSVAVALGALPVYWLARKHLGSERAGLGFALAYLLYPPTQWLTLNEFHPVALACPLLLFAIWYLDEGRLLPFALCALVAATTKEEIALVVAGLGIWYALAHGRRLEGAAIAAGGIAVALIAIEVVIPHFNRAGSSSFFSRYSEVGGSPGGILRTALTHPWTIVTTALTGRGLGYVARLAAPLGLLALGAPLLLIAALPELAINLLSAAPAQTSIRFHYTAGLIPVLAAGSIFGAARLAPRQRGDVATIAVALAVVSNYFLGAIPLWRYFPGGQQTQATAAQVSHHDELAAAALRKIPPHAVVSATNSLGAHLSARRRVLSFPFVQDATWIAADETSPGYADRLAPLPTPLQPSPPPRQPEG